MIYKGVRKNYLLNNQSIISQKKQQSDSYSKKSDSESFKSSNNSFEKNKNDLLKKRVENKIVERSNINKKGMLFKSRSQSINTLVTSLNISKPSTQLYQSSKIETKNSVLNMQQKRLQKVKFHQQYELSEISTQQPFPQTNSLIYDKDNFVRFSQTIVDLQDKKNKPQSRSRTPSILKNNKRTISCTKINSNYLKFRDKVIPQKNLDSNKMKYEKIIQNLKHKHNQRAKRQHNYNKVKQQQKYKDQIFPPTLNSIFLTKQRATQITKNIEGQIVWKRISEIFQDKKLVLYKPNSEQKITKKQSSIASKDFVFALNAIKNIEKYFQKVFQTNTYEQHGIYCVRIFQQNIWKYVVIDDYIPVTRIINEQKKDVFSPLFLTVQNFEDQVQIWPFLIQKAYASYYSSYQSLTNCNVQDLLEQFLMSSVKTVKFNQNQQDNDQMSKRLSHIINNVQTSKDIIFAKNVKSGQYTLITKKANSTTQVFITNAKGIRKMKIKNIIQVFTDIKIVTPFKLKYFNTSVINKVKKQKSTKFQPLSKIKIRQEIHIKTFAFEKDGEVQIMLRQKQKRFYARNGINYNYAWIRIILIQKQFNGGYRWIAGKYSNQKSLNIHTFLEKGQYQIIIMPQFPPESFYDITLILLSNQQCAIQKKNYEEDSKLIQNCCMDLAQRQGKFTQINQHMCSYSYIQKQTAIIIQNINNQRQYGSVALTRSLTGLKSKVQLYPFNIDFCINEYQPDLNKRKFKKSIQTLIDANQHFTVVIMMKNGIDHKFLQVFNFGN